MQRRMYCVLFLLLIKNVLFSQSINETISSQFDEIASSPMGNKEFLVSAYLGNRIYILQRTKDSTLVTSYEITKKNEISSVYSISVYDDTLFIKAVDTLYGDIKRNHSYNSYSKEVLTSSNFFIIFNEKNKLQIFCRREASQFQQEKIKYILNRLHRYLITPFKGVNTRVKFLKIENWNELLKYLSNSGVDSVPK